MKKLWVLVCMLVLLVGCTQVNETKPVSTTKDEKLSEMKVHFLDVGQGDSILIEAPNKKFMLIDGGVKGEGQNIVAYLQAQGVEELQYVVATHPDADHIGGLIAVLKSIKINNFIDSGKEHTSQTYEEMITLIADNNIPYIIPRAGEKISLDPTLDLRVISSDPDATDNNEASIVLKAIYGDVSFLLTGDAGVEMEKEMLKNNDLSATILKAGHHGSNTSSSPAFIQAVSPKVTILSYGAGNKYGHPHADVVQSLQQVGSKIYGTADEGHIVVTTNGQTYDVLANEFVAPQTTPATAPTGKVDIVAKDLAAELVTIKNNGTEAVNLSGWQLISVDGNQVFDFPSITLQPGKSLNVASGPEAKETNTTLKWTTKQIWLNSGDKAQLVNAKGEVVSELD